MKVYEFFVNQIKVPLLILVKVVDFYTPMESLVMFFRHLILVTFLGNLEQRKETIMVST